MDEMPFSNFLESIPPGKAASITEFVKTKNGSAYISTPQLQLYCRSDECQGTRFFIAAEDSWLGENSAHDNFLTYVCRNCRKSYKTFALSSYYDKDCQAWIVKKYAEDPAFGPPIPPRAFNLIGGERELFLLGRRCETQGMGIGAFVYYRRVIESQKNRIFDELARVIGKINPGDAILAELEAAKNETRFTQAVESIKHALPSSLNINGYNPLTLLHSALSEGVHNHTDEECLMLAGDIRAVLIEFAERLGQALKEEAEINAAVTRLAQKKK